MREMIRRVANSRVLAIAATAAAVCAVAGPYGTIEFPLLVRLYFWTVSIFFACGASIALIFYCDTAPRLQHLPRAVRAGIGAVAFGLVNATFLTGFTPLALGASDAIPGFWLYFLYSAPVAAAITWIIYLFRSSNDDVASTVATETNQAPTFVKRLKPALGQDLQRLSMQDHYVQAFTTLGNELILLRFSDALNEVQGIRGWRIHRSHWVAEAAVRGMRRARNKTYVILNDGAELPVSRTYLSHLREAGLVDKYLG